MSSGIQALSIRAVADEVGGSTRAVYSLFGSREVLVVALGISRLELLGRAIEAAATTTTPAVDLVEAAVAVFGRFAICHPALFTIAI